MYNLITTWCGVHYTSGLGSCLQTTAQKSIVTNGCRSMLMLGISEQKKVEIGIGYLKTEITVSFKKPYEKINGNRRKACLVGINLLSAVFAVPHPISLICILFMFSSNARSEIVRVLFHRTHKYSHSWPSPLLSFSLVPTCYPRNRLLC